MIMGKDRIDTYDTYWERSGVDFLGGLITAAGILMILAALWLAACNIRDAERAKEASDRIAGELGDRIDKSDANDSLPLLYTDPDRPMPTEMVDGYEYIGILEIPSQSLTLPVMSKWDYDRLNISPCRFSGSYFSDDLVICGHNFAKHFSPIRWVDIGEDIYFTNVEGLTIHYIITNRETVEPTDVKLMTENRSNSEESKMEWDMTLFTCNLGGQTRCAVRCSRVITEDINKKENSETGIRQ